MSRSRQRLIEKFHRPVPEEGQHPCVAMTAQSIISQLNGVEKFVLPESDFYLREQQAVQASLLFNHGAASYINRVANGRVSTDETEAQVLSKIRRRSIALTRLDSQAIRQYYQLVIDQHTRFPIESRFKGEGLAYAVNLINTGWSVAISYMFVYCEPGNKQVPVAHSFHLGRSDGQLVNLSDKPGSLIQRITQKTINEQHLESSMMMYPQVFRTWNIAAFKKTDNY